MKTQLTRTSKQDMTYLTQGNLALAPVAYPTFTVIEGGRTHEPQKTLAQVRADRRAHERAAHQATVRMMFVSIVIACAIIAFSMLTDGMANLSRSRAFSGVQTEEVTVLSGDSLWSIAENHPVQNRSTQEVVNWISEQNDLSNATLFAGQRLIVPMP